MYGRVSYGIYQDIDFEITAHRKLLPVSVILQPYLYPAFIGYRDFIHNKAWLQKAFRTRGYGVEVNVRCDDVDAGIDADRIAAVVE